MLQLMIKHLEGFAPLQRKILLYCFCTDTALIMKPICDQVETSIIINQETPIHMNTAWHLMQSRNIYSDIYKNPTMLKMLNTQGYVVYRELLVARIQIGNNYKFDLGKDASRRLDQLKEIWFEQRYSLLTKDEENGTPTGIIMRQYIADLNRRGLMLRQHESLWKRMTTYSTTAKFLFGEIRNKWGIPMELQYAVHYDLTRAIEEYVDMQWKIPVW